MDRPRWQRALAFAVSVWTLAWISGQFVRTEEPWTALAVFRGLLAPFDASVPEPIERFVSWLQEPARHSLGVGFALVGGLFWAATSERAQLSALIGWIAVMVSGEGLGYRPAVSVAALALLGFVLVLLLMSLPGRSFVDRRAKLLPADVLRAGTTAAALSAVVPLLAVGALLARLWSPYVTRPPRAGVVERPAAPAAERPRPGPVPDQSGPLRESGPLGESAQRRTLKHGD